MSTDLSGLDRSLWELATYVSGWQGESASMALLTVRWIGLAGFAPGFSSTTVSLRYRMAIALLMATLMIDGRPNIVAFGQRPFHEIVTILGTEFLVGAALGLSVALWISAARSAGEWIAFAAGLNIQTTYQPDWDGDSGESPTPIGRLFTMLGMLVFFAGHGPLRMMELIDLSLDVCPLGQCLETLRNARAESAFSLLGESLALSILVAWQIVFALITAQMAVALATKTKSIALSWSLLAPTRLFIGMLILATGFATVSASLSGTLPTWTRNLAESLKNADPNMGSDGPSAEKPEYPIEPSSESKTVSSEIGAKISEGSIRP